VVNRAYDGPVWTGPDTVEGSLGQMTRAFSRVLTHNTAIWWFDMWGGWYDDAAFMEFHKKAAEIYREHALAGGSPSAAPVAVFYDDSIAYATTPGSGISQRVGYELRKNLGAMGTPYRQYTLEDFVRVDPGEYRMAIFTTPCSWSDEQCKALEAWKRDGRMLVFLGPTDSEAAHGIRTLLPGSLETLSAEAERADALQVPAIRYQAEPGDVVLQRGNDGEAAAILRCRQECSIYVSTELAMPADSLRKLVCAAAGQVYCFDGDVVYASEKYLAVHAAKDGVKRICYPFRGRLVNALTGEALPGNECYAEVKMRLGETLLLEVQHD